MAIDTEAKRWSMLAHASSPPRTVVFNPDTSGLVSIEKITVLQYYGGNAWDDPVIVIGGKGNRGGFFTSIARGGM